MIELSEGAEALFYEACKLTEETSDIDDFRSTFFDDFKEVKGDFVKVKGNHTFLNKNLLLNNDLDQEFD